jgi:5-oxoprolinase (ATP-hydrolysing) subunit A
MTEIDKRTVRWRSNTMQIDINCDMGESFGAYRLGSDEEMVKYITSANIACGYHAGDPVVLDRTVKLVLQHGVQIGSHVSYPDLMGFGRRPMTLSTEEIENYTLYQIGALWAFAKANKVEIRHVKAHGALGNLTHVDIEASRALARGIARFSKELLVYSIPCAPLVIAAQELGLKVAEEFYPERGYNADGTLQSRKMPGSSIHDPKVATERALRMIKEGVVIAHTGETVQVRAHTVCVHGDNPMAPQIVSALVTALKAEGIQIKSTAEFV